MSAKRASSGRGRSGGGAGKRGRPRSKAAEKATDARRQKHAAASVRNADRKGGKPRPDRSDRPAGGGRRRSNDRGLGGDRVEGRQAVRELLLAGRRRVREVLVAADLDDNDVLRDIAEIGDSLGVPVREVTRNKLYSQAQTEAPQGVIANAAPLPEADLDDLITGDGATAPFLLALDGVTDPGNLGAVLRSAECAGVTGVVLPRHRAVHVTPTVTKAAAGAVEYLPMTVVGGLPTAISRLREAGVRVIGLDAAGERPLFDLSLGDEPVCLVLGAEGAGLSRLVRQRCDELASLPLLGHLASLNVSAAGALACYEVARRRLG